VTYLRSLLLLRDKSNNSRNFLRSSQSFKIVVTSKMKLSPMRENYGKN